MSETSAVNQTLRHYAAMAKRPIYMAWGLSVVSTLVLIVQSWLIAVIFADWLTQISNHRAATDVFFDYLPWLIGCLLLRPLLHFCKDQLALDAGLQVASILRKTLVEKLAQVGAARDQYGSDGGLASMVIEQCDALTGYVSRFYLQRLIVVSTPIMLLVAAATQSWMATLILLLTAPLVPVFMVLIGHATARKSRQQFAAMAQLSGRFLDWLRGTATLQRLDAVGHASQDIDASAEAYRMRTMSVLKIAFLNTAALELLAALSIALLAVYLGFGLIGILPWQKNTVPVPYQSALFLLLLAPEFYAPLRQLGADYHVKAQAEGAIAELSPLLAFASAEKTKANPFILTAPPAIDADNIWVNHQQRTRLAPLSFAIAAGERLAIVGQSGSGKSTLLQIFLGFCAYQGDIFIDNQNFNTINSTQFRHQIAYLSQQTMLLPMSIADNLRLPNPTASDDKLWQILAQVGLKPLIKALPNQLDTQLGERGSGLSGGQQRRLAIAQLLLQDAQLWLLDEPTEHLDSETAAEINALLQQVTRGKTVLWVTHDATNLPWLDRQISLDIASTLAKV
ncbi:thiol reductant ABC exporter subunit CydD [Moraxella osloensis]|uniref:Thiol reductant ABC exporter subunit CydD n=1 Tax=Faucicola osloensis TaxID=34062 RepID=A0AAW6TBV6_FAUOS|nr:thiol reductant ABC exporter subunit CydD [Moraxella osloensis]MDI4508600.1 thiol reductant ABC exporter subunit CydD [Moraxella osloensis]